MLANRHKIAATVPMFAGFAMPTFSARTMLLVWCLAIAPAAAQPTAPDAAHRPQFDTNKRDPGPAPDPEKAARTVVAEVGDQTITLGDIKIAIQALPPSLARFPLEALYPSVMEQLIRQKAAVILGKQQRLDDDPAIGRKMRAASDTVLANEYVGKAVLPTIAESDLLARYDRDYAGRPGPEEVRLRVIRIATEAEAKAILGELKAGADFAALAQRSSLDLSKTSGGDIGFHPRDGLQPELAAVGFALEAGQMAANPVLSAGAWFIVKVEERRQGATPAFAALRGQLIDSMLRDRVPPFYESIVRSSRVRRYNLVEGEGGR